MIITATFIGINSLGYEHGKSYELHLNHTKDSTIRRPDGKGRCSYDSLSAFLKNWNNIQVVPN